MRSGPPEARTFRTMRRSKLSRPTIAIQTASHPLADNVETEFVPMFVRLQPAASAITRRNLMMKIKSLTAVGEEGLAGGGPAWIDAELTKHGRRRTAPWTSCISAHGQPSSEFPPTRASRTSRHRHPHSPTSKHT